MRACSTSATCSNGKVESEDLVQLAQERREVHRARRPHLDHGREGSERRRHSRARHGQVRDAGRRKDEFLAILAHELRDPIAAVLADATFRFTS